MYGHIHVGFIAGWVALIGGANWFAYRRAIDVAAGTGSRSAPKRASWVPVAEAVGLTVSWSSLPLYLFAALPPASQVIVGLAFGAVTAASIALVAVPVAAIAAVSCLSLAFCAAYVTGAQPLDLKIGAAIAAFAGLVSYGVVRLSSWADAQIRTLARIKGQSESIRLLLREYEHRGVGWLWQVDSENRVVYISSRMTALLGRSTSQLVGHSLPASLGGNSALGRTLLARQPFSNLEMELKTRSGPRWISLAGDPIIDMGGQFQGFRGVGSDVTEVRKTQERLTNLANMDVLSGLPNRGRVRQLLGEALSTAQATNVPCAIMFLDLDGFKPVNDTFGHPKGDAVLKSVAQRLVKEVGDAGHVGRMGGDEFAIVIKDAQGRKTVENLAKRLIESVAAPYHIDKVEIRIGTSIGCAFGPIDGQSVDDLIQKADMALYQAKNEGRGTCCYFNDDMRSGRRAPDAARAGSVERDLQRAAPAPLPAADQRRGPEPGRFRSAHPLAPPDPWHRAAQRLHPACGRDRPHHAPRRLGDRGSVPRRRYLARQYHRRGEPVGPPARPSGTAGDSERGAFQAPRPGQPARARSHRDRLPRGYGRLARRLEAAPRARRRHRARRFRHRLFLARLALNKAVFHKLKIDGSFVREAARNKETVAIIQSIVQLAKSFRMTITAEGVETADDFTRMRDLGCHQIQGYLFGRPMSYERASELVHGTSAKQIA